ncbi:disease resistance protein TAO1-like [Punica granatum]|uniref:Disease resistance protein TAO1-like n=1 Tax=Punica granatum TaxID=22663 RepID=A0A6P8BUS7_PUNGR|nr:disease resistance protein TAO1-like [Punica granatum]
MDERAKFVEESLDVESGDVRFLVIHGERGTGKKTLARALFLQLSARFQGNNVGDNSGKSRSAKESFRDKKFLTVLDGVDKWQQIKKVAGRSTWFGSGSRIIITSPNRGVLPTQPEVSEERNLNQAREVFGFEMKEMELNQAVQVFSRYAFGQDSPLETFENWSLQIVMYSQKLPLILEIMGSLLHRMCDTQRWDQIIQSLMDSTTVKDKLRISYDALKDNARTVFLDIACFFRARKDIVGNNYCDPLWKHNRVWIHEEALKVLKNKEIQENNLRVIDLKCCGILTKTPPFISVQESGETEIDHSIGELRGLKCLNIKGCDSLEKLPEEICSLEMLTEILITKKVCNSFGLPESIGSLKSLTTLEIVSVRMAQIPESIGSLENLQRLSLLGCSGFEKLPKSFGQLKSLVELDIADTQIIGLPKSIRKLKELKVIKMEHSSIKKSPRTIGKVEKLEELHAKHSRDLQGEVPDGIGMFCHLKISDLSHTSLGRLPENLSQLTHLKKLQIQPCSPGSTLSHLVIDTRHYHPLTERYNLELTKLEKLELHVPNVPNLKPKFQFPDMLKSLHLSCQDLHCCSELPSSLSKLTLTNVAVNTRLLHLDNLERLSSLELLNCELIDDRGTIEIGRLATLVHFSASRCLFSIANGLRPPKTLRVLNVIECEFRNTILHLSGLKCLKRLEISY